MLAARHDAQGSGLPGKAERFLHPFNLRPSLATNIEAEPTGVDRRLTMEEDGVVSMQEEELAQEFRLTEGVVQEQQREFEATLQAWRGAQGDHALEGRVSAAEWADTCALIRSQHVTKLIVTLSYYVYETVVKASPAFPERLAAVAQQALTHLSTAGGGSTSRSVGAAKRAAAMLSSQALYELDLGYRQWVLDQQARQPPPADAAGGGGNGGGSGRGEDGSHHSSAASSEPASGFATPRATRHDVPNVAAAPPPARASAQSSYSLSTQPSASASAAAAPAAAVATGAMPRASVPSAAAASSTLQTATAGASVAANASIPSLARNSSSATLGGAGPSSATSSSRLTGRMSSLLTNARAVKAAVQLALHAEPEPQELQSKRLFALHQEVARLFKEQRKTRAGMFFTMPALLLCIRVAVSALFCNFARSWTTTPSGKRALHAIDGVITDLFDPHGYLQQGLSLLQSTPAAVKMLSKYAFRAHVSERAHFNDTSNLVRLTMASACAPETRRLLAAGASGGSGLLRKTTAAHAAAASPRGAVSTRTASAAAAAAAADGAGRPEATALTTAQREQLFVQLQALRAEPDPQLYRPQAICTHFGNVPRFGTSPAANKSAD